MSRDSQCVREAAPGADDPGMQPRRLVAVDRVLVVRDGVVEAPEERREASEVA